MRGNVGGAAEICLSARNSPGRVNRSSSNGGADETRSGGWKEANSKVEKEQTQRIVINLQDWNGDLDALQRQFATWPFAGLKEVKVITKGRPRSGWNTTSWLWPST
jgi:hypothetical protein